MDLPKTKEELYDTYYLKEDLINMCKEHNLPSNGSKENLLEYICNFIENKHVKKIKSKRKRLLQNFSFATATAEKRSFTARRAKNCKSLCKSNRLLQQARNINNNDFEPSLDKPIDVNYSNNEIHRAFFKNTIGEQFKFNVKFMEWMEKNKGKKTYEQAIEMYKKILMDKKSGKKEKIGKQFEYNQYTRDFFENNPKSSMEDCIKCWNYKKKQIGNHKYGKDDLKILETCFYSKNTQKPSK